MNTRPVRRDNCKGYKRRGRYWPVLLERAGDACLIWLSIRAVTVKISYWVEHEFTVKCSYEGLVNFTGSSISDESQRATRLSGRI